MTRTDTSLVGTLLERRYRVDRLLARGGMSSVYRGTDTRLDRQVAIKIMDPRFADDRSFVERFEREARSAARLHHPHVVAVHDQGFDTPGGEESGRAFLVMELVDGGTLRDLMDEQGPLDIALALSVAEPVLSALAAAHHAGLVHRDVKPENVLIGRGGTVGAGGVVKVADFGLVRAVASAGTTSSSVILGTVAYLSPEQVTTGETGSSGDVYSAGILLYEMLTGRAPYTGDTALSVAYRHVNDDVPRPSELRPGVPPALDELILRATRRDATLRPADAGIFLQELSRVRTELGIPLVAVPVPPPPDVDGESDVERTLPRIPVVEQTAPVSGPRGTRALTRAVPLMTPPQQQHNQQPPRQQPPTPPSGNQAAGQRKRKRVIALAVAGVLILGGLIGALAFIFTDSATTGASTVPQLAGLNQAAAGDSLRQVKLTPKYVEEYSNTVQAHVVIRSDPAAGASLQPGSTVTVLLSKGKPVVPDIQVGSRPEDAEKAIQDAQLVPQRSGEEYSADAPQGTVLRVDPKPGTQVDLNSPVTLVLSKGPEPLPPVPDVRGQPKDQAFNTLKAAGFEPFQAGEEFAQDVEAGSVTRTSPEGGAKAGTKKVGVFVSNAVTVPDVRYKSFDDAEKILTDAGLKADRDGHGRGHGGFSFVLQQDPEPGTKVQKDSKVKLKGVG
ncbi:Stk1 family PASTA domain-containing Ser/Thr kinase [Amycolatopsis sp. H20-H5]|uniref:Stk1 family PASTA domain-containing Ser/Thr kinase n=1 Tax=Amycolatopsis sp. H20-H5 TaxID=3046309 RepID=UPI002DBE8B16|nr:PASTA domain-containing protein [Amycolatopsis sp. H20-H5]MEC3980019.1 PASTA domain-containing protein [Amycolatopsis sp. H20-H5]